MDQYARKQQHSWPGYPRPFWMLTPSPSPAAPEPCMAPRTPPTPCCLWGQRGGGCSARGEPCVAVPHPDTGLETRLLGMTHPRVLSGKAGLSLGRRGHIVPPHLRMRRSLAVLPEEGSVAPGAHRDPAGESPGRRPMSGCSSHQPGSPKGVACHQLEPLVPAGGAHGAARQRREVGCSGPPPGLGG